MYARVQVSDIERRLAVARARILLDAVLQISGPPVDAWKVLGSHVLFGKTERFTTTRSSAPSSEG